MEGLLYISFNAFCLTELLMVFLKIYKSTDKRMNQIMLGCFIGASMILLLSDIVWGVFEFYVGWHTYPAASFLVNSMYHILTGVVAYSWFLFSESSQDSRLVKRAWSIALSMIPLFVVMNLVAGSNAHGWVFYIDPITHQYQRGEYYFVIIIAYYWYIIHTTSKALIKALRKDNFLRKNQLLTLASFAIFPAVTGVLQVVFVGSPLLSAGIAFAVLHVYINSRELIISIDPMTKLSNRKQMEAYLYGKMKNRNNHRDLYVFIMDLDYFKQINDKYGHVEGDEAIVIAANAIRQAVDKTGFFASRYGGDEFVVVGETNKDFKPKEFLNRVNEILGENTKKAGKEYTLKFSVGYKRYSPEFTDVRDFIAAADEGLYMIKKSRPRLINSEKNTEKTV